MAGQAGYYSWVCFIDAQRGAWFGPIPHEQVDDYNQGFALDDNIKSWTDFTYYESRPSGELTCNFDTRKKVIVKPVVVPKSISISDCLEEVQPKSGKSSEMRGRARLLLYNSVGVPLFATLSEHQGRKEIPGRPNWVTWEFNDEYPDHTYLVRVYEGDSVILRIDIRPVGRDIHIEVLENSSGFYYRFNEPW